MLHHLENGQEDPFHLSGGKTKLSVKSEAFLFRDPSSAKSQVPENLNATVRSYDIRFAILILEESA